MKKLLFKILSLFRPKYNILYKKPDGIVGMYTVSEPKRENEFSNEKEGLAAAGFRSYCFNREGIRSFRYDRIININKI